MSVRPKFEEEQERLKPKKLLLLDEFNEVWEAQVARGELPELTVSNVYLCDEEKGGQRGTARVWELKKDGLVTYTHKRVKDGSGVSNWRVQPGPKHPLFTQEAAPNG